MEKELVQELPCCKPEPVEQFEPKDVDPDLMSKVNVVVLVDFTNYPDLHAKLLELAHDQDRTPELQARNIIRLALNLVG